MRWFPAGEHVSFHVPFLANGEFVTPDAGSIKLTMRDAAGAIISGYQNLALPTGSPGTVELISTVPGDTSYSNSYLLIDASLNALSGTDPESRFISIYYSVAGTKLEFKLAFKLHPFLPLMVTPGDVRAEFGAEFHELPDDEIDIITTYYQMVAEGTLPSDVLWSPTIASVYACQAIKAQTSLDVIGSMPARLRKLESGADSSVQRMKVDFAELKEVLEVKLKKALDGMNAALVGQISQSSISLAAFSSVNTTLFPG